MTRFPVRNLATSERAVQPGGVLLAVTPTREAGVCHTCRASTVCAPSPSSPCSSTTQEWTFIPGGFLGVEVFFVISGYLITFLILAQWRTTGRVELKAFWVGRARRLLPALYVVLVVTLTYAVVFLPGWLG